MWFFESLYPDIKIGLKGKLIYSKKSLFQDLKVFSTSRFGKMLTLGGAIQTTEKDEFIYHEMMSHPALLTHKNPKNVLIIGAGDGGVLREVLKHPVKKVTLVEIDKTVIELSKKYLPNICRNSFSDKRLNLVIADGAKFISRSQDKFDVAIIDSPDPVGVARVLFSKKFYTNLYNTLKSDGIMVRHIGSTFLQSKELKSNYKVSSSIFKYTNLFLAAIPTYIGGFFSFVMASKKYNPLNVKLKEIDKRFKLKTKYYNPPLHLASFILPNYVRGLLK